MNIFASIVSTPDLIMGIVLLVAVIAVVFAIRFGRRLLASFFEGYDGKDNSK